MFKVKDGIRIGATEFVDASRNITAGTVAASDVTLTGELRGPATMYIDPAAVGDNTGTLVIRGNLQVDGTTTTINSTTLSVDDLNIVLADGAANAAAANGAGITISGAGATFTYASSGDKWQLNKPLEINGYTVWHTGNLTNLNQLTNGPGYLTTESDTLATVTSRGATTSTATTFSGVLTASSVFNAGAYSIQTFDITASNTTYWTVTQPDGSAIANGHIYRISMSTSGTGTDTGEVYLLSNPDSLGWQVKLVSSTGRGSNYPYVFLDSGVPKVKTDHPSNYTIRVIVERYVLNNTGSLTTGLGLEAYFGVDQGTPKFRGTWNGTDYTVWHAGNLTNLNQLTNGPGYITAESDTLATVTGRGASTSNSVTLSGMGNQLGGHFYFIAYDAAGNHYPHFNDGGSASGSKINWRLFTGATNSVTHLWRTDYTYFANRVESASDMRATLFYDASDTSFYVDPANTGTSARFAGQIVVEDGIRTRTSGYGSPYNLFALSDTYDSGTYYGIKYVEGDPDVIQVIGGNNVGLSIGMDTGNTTASHSLRAPIFYDSSNTTYYVDPADGGFYLRGGSSNRVTYYTDDSGYKVLNAEGLGLQMRIGAAWGRGGIYSNSYLDLGAESNINFRIANAEKGTMDSSSNLFAYGSMRAPIFYDYNDTNYYVDPNSASIINTLTINGSNATGQGQATSVGLTIRGYQNYQSLEFGIEDSYVGVIRSYGNDLRYYAGHWRTTGTNATEDHSHYWYTSKSASANWSTYKMRLDHTGKLTVNSADSSVQLRLLRQDGAGTPWNFYSWAGGLNIFPDSASTIYIGRDGGATDLNVYNGNMYAGIYYDKDDTNYYLNPNSYSNLNRGRVAGRKLLHYTDGTAFNWTGSASQYFWNRIATLSYEGQITVKIMAKTDFNYLPMVVAIASFNTWNGSTFSVKLDVLTSYDIDLSIAFDNSNQCWVKANVQWNNYLKWQIINESGGNTIYDSITYQEAQPTNSIIVGPGQSARGTYGNVTATSAFTSSNHYISGLTVRSDVRAPIFYDSNDTSYYFDGASTTRTNVIQTNYIGVNQAYNSSWPLIVNGNAYLNGGSYGQAEGSWRAPIFYDSNDTAYYLNPRSGSRLSGLRLDGVDDAASGEDAIFWINKPNNNDWAMLVTGGWDYGIDLRMAASHTYAIRALKNGSEYSRLGTDVFYHNNQIHAPIFYDHNNTAFYADPDGYSRFNALNLSHGRLDSSERFPVGHYSSGETVFEIDPMWTNTQLQAYFNTSNVTWVADSTAPGGYAIQIVGNIGVGGEYQSGFPYIPVEQDDIFYMECWIKDVSGTNGHYMGSMDYNHNLSSLGGNPGSYGYWVMSNSFPGTSWQKYSGYITGFGTSTGTFVSGTKYWTPLALFNYTGGGTSYISGWKITRVNQRGKKIIQATGLSGGTATSYQLQIQNSIGASTLPDLTFGADGSYSYIQTWNSKPLLVNNQGNYTQFTDVRATIYYDSNNTAYYADPNSTSRFNSVRADNWFRPEGESGLYSHSYGQHFYPDSGGFYWDIDGPLRVRDGFEGTVKGYVGYHDSAGFGMLHNGGSWWLNTPDNNNLLVIGGYNGLTAYGNAGAKLLFKGADTDAQDNYYIGTNFENYGGNYSKLDLRWHTGIRIGAQAIYGGVRIFDSEDLGTVRFSVNKGDSNTRVETGSFYAPIMYDIDNTTYYVDPAPGTNGISANFQGRIQVGTFNASQVNSGEAWIGRASDRSAGGLTVQLGTVSSAYFEIIDKDWTTVILGASMNAFTYKGSNIWHSGNLTNLNQLTNGPGYITSVSFDGLTAKSGGTGTYTTTGDFRAPIFYNHTDTSYYVDPDSLSVMNRISLGYNSGENNSIGCSNWFRSSGSSGWYNASYGGGIWQQNSTWVEVYNNKQFYVQNYIQSDTSVRAPIFYDSNDTYYYTDPNSTSSFRNARFYTSANNSISITNDDLGATHFTDRNGRYLTSNGSNWIVDGLDVPLVISGSYTTTTRGRLGLALHNEASTTNAYSPAIIFGAKSNSGSYNSAYAFIMGKKTGYASNLDTNWNAGELHFFTVGIGNSDDTPSLRIWNDGDLETKWSVRAPIFYDRDNTGYYVDPNSGSLLNTLTTNEIYTWGWFRNHESGDGLYNSGTGQHWYSDSSSYWNMGGGVNGQGIRFRDTHNSTIRGYVYYDQSNNVGFLNNAGGWGLRIVSGDYGQADGSSMRAQIFYDSNNTAYYFDGSATGTSINVAGSIVAAGSVSAYSDIRIKTNIEVIPNALDKVKKLRGITYNRIDNPELPRQTGVIAQEVKEVLPEAVSGHDLTHYTVAYGNMVGLLIEAIKEQDAKIERLEALVTTLITKL